MDIPTDLLVEVLKRLPWTSRRRLRLVCRTWRDLVHQRTTEMQQRRDAVPLVVTWNSAYILDDLDTCKPRDVFSGVYSQYKHMKVVGVCNGVLCLCDDTKPDGAITLVNPATGDVLVLPPIPCEEPDKTRLYNSMWHLAYCFGFHHRTGQYKVVHAPCFVKTKETLQVFTVGEASWREVPAPADMKCRMDVGLVSVNGSTYWFTEGEEPKIMSFDLKSEQVKPIKTLPMPTEDIRDLTEVQRRLSITTSHGHDSEIKVWILETKEEEQTWIHQYTLHVHPPPVKKQQLTGPNFLHGEYVLFVGGQGEDKLFRYLHMPVNYLTTSECTVVHTHSCSQKLLVLNYRGPIRRTFAYIKTTEALSVYRLW